MDSSTRDVFRLIALALSLSVFPSSRVFAEPRQLEEIPDKLVVLTFDDSNKSDITNVAPILERYGFGASCG